MKNINNMYLEQIINIINKLIYYHNNDKFQLN